MGPVPVEFRTVDGLTLRGHRSGAGDRWAVLAHEEGRDLDAWRGLAAALRRAGLVVLAFDLRGHGASDDPWEAAKAPLDVAAALGFAEAEGATRLVLVGAGIGATAALVASTDHPVRAVVGLSPVADPVAAPDDVLRRVRAPKLLFAGSGDRRAAAEAGAVYRRSSGWSVLETPPVTEQGTDLLRSAWGDHVREHTLAFLRDYV